MSDYRADLLFILEPVSGRAGDLLTAVAAAGVETEIAGSQARGADRADCLVRLTLVYVCGGFHLVYSSTKALGLITGFSSVQNVIAFIRSIEFEI